MILQGRVLDGSGKPVSGTIVYAYQTNAQGKYAESDSSMPCFAVGNQVPRTS